jgi:hypothetical protein
MSLRKHSICKNLTRNVPRVDNRVSGVVKDLSLGLWPLNLTIIEKYSIVSENNSADL